MSTTQSINSGTTDSVDDQIIHALQISPRASFHHIGEVLGLPERTVARRYRRLRREGLIRVTVLVAPSSLGGSTHHVQLRCTPGVASDLTRKLSRSDDISWILVHDASHRIQFSVRCNDSLEDTLASLIPTSASISEITTSTMLHRFIGSSPDDWTTWSADALSAEQTTALTPAPSAAHPAPGPITDADRRMVEHLTSDGRTSYSRLARILGTTAGTVTRRIEALLAAGVIYFDIDIAPAVTGRRPATLSLRVPPAEVGNVGHSLAALPHVPFAAAVSGAENIVASVMVTGAEDLYRFISTDVASLQGVTAYSVFIADRMVKTAGAVISGDRLAPPRVPRVLR